MKVYTKTGDGGQTSLLSGQRIAKDDVRVEAYGTVDEANTAMGLAKSLLKNAWASTLIEEIQRELIELNADLAVDLPPGQSVARIDERHVVRLEEQIDMLETKRIPQKYFVTPGGCPAGAALDMARTMVRRAERCVVRLRRSAEISRAAALYLNRLSDLLFVLARCVEQDEIIAAATGKIMAALQTAEKKAEAKGGMTMLDKAKKLLAAAEYKALEIGVPMVIAVVDDGGNLVAQQRMDGALLASISLALDKAYTAVALRLPTDQAASLVTPGNELFGLNTAGNGRFIVFGGGFPITERGVIIGGIGVSGGSVHEDMLVAKAALAAL